MSLVMLAGLVTGLVVDIGDGVTHIIPVIDGCSFPHLTKRLNVAGRDVTARLVSLLQRRGYALNKSADFETVRALKERLCYVAADYQRELQVIFYAYLPAFTVVNLKSCNSSLWRCAAILVNLRHVVPKGELFVLVLPYL